MWRNACSEAISDGAAACVVVDVTSATVLEGIDDGPLGSAAKLAALLVRPGRSENGFVTNHGAPSAAVSELLVVGREHSIFAALDPSRPLAFFVALPASMSVALGWAILRRVVAVGAGA